MAQLKSICVYCGSQDGVDPAARAAAATLGAEMASAGIGLVYGGGAKGLMGAVARAVLEAGGEVTGVIPSFLISKETNAEWLSRLTRTVTTRSMHERKQAMFELSDAFVALPGGLGTLEELVEIMTWAQLGRHEKPIVLANFGGFWTPFLGLMNHMRAQGFIHTEARVRPIILDDAAAIVSSLAAHRRDGAAPDPGMIADL